MRRFSVCVTLLLLASATTARMRTDVVFDAEVDFSAFESYGWKIGHDKDSGHALSEGEELLWSAASRDIAGSREALQGKGPRALKKILKLLPVDR